MADAAALGRMSIFTNKTCGRGRRQVLRSGKGKTVWTIHGYQRADAGERKKAETFPNGDQAGEETKH